MPGKLVIMYRKLTNMKYKWDHKCWLITQMRELICIYKHKQALPNLRQPDFKHRKSAPKIICNGIGTKSIYLAYTSDERWPHVKHLFSLIRNFVQNNESLQKLWWKFKKLTTVQFESHLLILYYLNCPGANYIFFV